MNRPAGDAPAGDSTYVQALPIYLASDAEVARYFRDCRDEIDAITGLHVVILIAREIDASDAAGVAAALDAGEAARFPGLRFADLPCLWIEDSRRRSALLRLPHAAAEIGQVMRTLADVCRETKDAPEIARLVETRRRSDAKQRSPLLSALLEELPVTKSQERLIAVACGVVFVAAILVIALFIPSPTAFQYTVFRIVLALAAAGFVSMTPGFIEAQVGNFVRAGGALAVFIIVFFYAPAALGSL
ncbi:hypothetical protein [Sphingosinicella terrae]|uniref:hypothetical protein n=1 Tax=Sphingosinicella terrae TaxID=2172047 RepID=UPI000E0DCB01|nr:hypothetical protein [Sphingosinicella terrae]